MAVNPNNPEHRARIQTAVRYAFESASDERKTRERLVDIFGDSASDRLSFLTRRRRRTLVNYFQQFVRGRLTTLAANMPKWAVKARTLEGRGFDRQIKSLLDRYSEVLDMHSMFKACALDSAFGRSVVKVITSVAPKGVTSPFAPRAFRISPDSFLVDRATLSPIYSDATFMGDVYWVPLEEAKGWEQFDPDQREGLSAHHNSSSDVRVPDEVASSNRELFVEDMVRLVDLYFPSSGVIATWEANDDTFSNVGSTSPLQIIETPVNPYSVFAPISFPNSLKEYSPLALIEELHLLANDMLDKAAEQARSSKRHPVGDRSADEDLHALLEAPDNEPVLVDDLEKIGIYSIPGADPSLLSLAAMSGQLLSSSAGNLEVALGQSAGASTARQTNAILQQINTVQDLDRSGFELFMSEVARKIATLAFYDESFTLKIMNQVPGTNFVFSMDWAPPHLLPRTTEIDNFDFEVVPYSSSFRSPQERLAQLQQASQMMFQGMQFAAQGAPLNIGAMMETLEDTFDLAGDLSAWWSGEPPAPTEQALNTYNSLASPAQGSTLQYESNSPAGGGQQAPSLPPPSPGGVQTI